VEKGKKFWRGFAEHLGRRCSASLKKNRNLSLKKKRELKKKIDGGGGGGGKKMGGANQKKEKKLHGRMQRGRQSRTGEEATICFALAIMGKRGGPTSGCNGREEKQKKPGG